MVARRGERLRDFLLKTYFSGQVSLAADLRTFEADLDRQLDGKVYSEITPRIRENWCAVAEQWQRAQGNVAAAALLADLIARAPERLSQFPVPQSILPHFIHEFSRILEELEARPDAARGFEDDVFLKDLGICRLEVYPCVAQVVDKNSGLSRAVVASQFLRAPAKLITLGLRTRLAYRPFLEIHTHTPMLAGFTPEGWDACYVLVADLLKACPGYVGLVGGSWFYDPELDHVSPRLSYLRERPVDGGAFLLRVGPSAIDIANATATSESRRKLYESGKYQPAKWLMVWPRGRLLKWVEVNRERISQTRVVARNR